MPMLRFAEKIFPALSSLFLLLSFGLLNNSTKRPRGRGHRVPSTAINDRAIQLLQLISGCFSSELCPWAHKLLKGYSPSTAIGSLTVIRYAPLKREVQGKREKHSCIFIPFLIEFKMEPETFGQDFPLLISFWLLFVGGGFCLFCFLY